MSRLTVALILVAGSVFLYALHATAIEFKDGVTLRLSRRKPFVEVEANGNQTFARVLACLYVSSLILALAAGVSAASDLVRMIG